jgi:phasin family protein
MAESTDKRTSVATPKKQAAKSATATKPTVIAKPTPPQAAKPVEAKAAPVAAPKSPVETKTVAVPKPAPVEAKAPVAPKPAPAEAKPVIAKAAPVEPKPAAIEIKAPAAAKPAPVEARPVPAPKPVAPVQETPAVAPAPVAAKEAPVASKTKSAPTAEAPAPKPAEVAASKQDKPVAESRPAPVEFVTKQEALPAVARAITEGSKTMNETVMKAQEAAKNFTADAGVRVQALFGEVSERAKGAYEKSVKMTEELTEFQKGNVEAMVESSKLAAKAAESLGQEAADYARKSFESSTAAFKTFASAKSPTELFKLQSDYMKTSFDSAVAESSKVTEAWLKLAGDIAQPLSNRFAVAVEKVKATAAI